MDQNLFYRFKTYLEENEISKKALLRLAIAMAAFLVVCCILLIFSPSDEDQIFPVYITEVLASNTSYPNADGRCCDYIELHNSADYPINLTGFQLGDIAGNARYSFPSGTTIDAGGYLVVYCDKTIDDAAYAPFGISRSGNEAFYLIGSNSAIVDSVTTIAMDLDQSMVLLNSGEWAISDIATPGRANDDTASVGLDVFNAEVSPVRITEFSSANTGYVSMYNLLCDWVELHNTSNETVDISGFTLSDNIGNDKYVFPSGTVIAPGEFYVVYCSTDGEWEDIAPFGLSQFGGETLVLKNSQHMVVEIVDSPVMDDGCSMTLGADGTWAATQLPSPGFENSDSGHKAFLAHIGAEKGSIVISEVMSGSQLALPDSYGAFSDWVELYNTGIETISLSGWFLSDDPTLPQKWEIPQLEIAGGERVIVFCSGRGIVTDGEVHADFSLSSAGEDLVLSSYVGNVVDSVSFGEAESGCSFIFDSGSALSSKTPTPGFENTEAGYEQFCAASAPTGPLAIWEVMTSNDTYLPQALGECYDWVELRNISDSTVNLSDYSITDDPDTPGMFVLPDKMLEPEESIIIILSGDETLSSREYAHAGFSLNASEDQLLLYDRDGKLLDFVYLKDIPLGYSYGRSEETGGFFYQEPSPKKKNNDGLRLISAIPTSDYAPGLYIDDSEFTVSLQADGVIYYTTDGSDPDSTCAVYREPIQIDSNTVLRAISVEDGKLSSDIYTATFLINVSHSIPVVSFVTDPDNLWGDDGIYKNNDITIKEERRSANIAYLGEDGRFSINCQTSLHGDTTVTHREKKSFTVRFRDDHDGILNYDVFGDGEVTLFRSLIVRAAHEGYYSTHIRDALLGHIAAQSSDSMVSQKYKYVALYINGEYWGLYALREHHSDVHYATYMDVPASTVSFVRYCIDEENSIKQFFRFCEDSNLRSDENYEYAKSVLKMESIADWIIFESYVGNLDINGNMRYYHSTVDNLWYCGLVDVDLGMFSLGAFEQTANAFHHGQIVKDLLENKEFQDLIATRLAELLAGPLSDENMLNTLNMMVDSIRDEIPLECNRWGYTQRNWENEVKTLFEFCNGRSLTMINSLCAICNFTQAQKEAYFGDLLE